MDTPISIQQTRVLINWIEETAPNREISYIYITHGHPDHWFGLTQLLQRWPEAIPLATPGTIAHMKESVEPSFFARSWGAFFPGQIYQPFTFAQPLRVDGTFLLEDRWKMRAIECGHSDPHETTVLWVPDLRLAVCGEVVYGDCHQMLAFANTRVKREEWIRAVEKVEALNPLSVVPGHKRPGELDLVWHLANTKKYIEDFGKVMATDPQTPKEIYQGITRMYPNRLNPLVPIFSVDGAFRVSRKARI